MTACLALTGSLFGVADTVFRMPERMGGDPDAASESTLMKKTAGTVDRRVEELLKGNPFAVGSDRAALDMYLEGNTTLPSMAPAFSPFGPEDDTEYKYTGFNVAAGLMEDGTTQTGGLVNFNIQPFACDTVSSDPGVSPYSFVKKEKLYCFLPKTDAYGKYLSMTVTTYDANTLERLDSKDVDLPVKSSSYVPYIASYDDRRDMVYAISMENGKDRDGYSITEYYINMIDMDSWQLKRIAFLGDWSSVRSSGNFNPKGMAFGYGSCYVLNSDDKQYVERLDVSTGKREVIGYTELPTQYVYGLQPMVYDSSGSLIVNHYNFTDGTVYYKVQPFVAYGSTEKICKTDLIEKAPTGFTFFYQRPETVTSIYTKYLDEIADLTVTPDHGSNKVSISLTVPATINGGQEIEIPSWSNDCVRCYVYVDNGYSDVTLPSEIHLGDKLEFAIEDVTAGMHVVTVNITPFYNVVAALRQSEVVCAGYDVPANVGDPALEITDGKALITWTAPTQGKFADFGSRFDASDLTYTVVRDLDGKEVAKDITTTRCEDNELGEEIHSYTYTIYASSHGATNEGISTNVVTAGTYAALPYENHFNVPADVYGWTILNLNNDGSYRTWGLNTYLKSMVNPSSNNGWSDDWLISPNVKLDSGKLYELSYVLTMGSALPDGSLKVTIGQGITPEAQDEVLADFDKVTATNQITRHYFNPSEDGLYNFGFHDYSMSEYGISIDDVVFKEIADISAPGQVRQLVVTPDADGAVGATVRFTLPLQDIAGNTLAGITEVTVYSPDWTELTSKTSGLKPGEEVSLPVKSEEGVNRFFVVASNAAGEGWPAEASAYVGLDIPSPVSNIDAHWGDDDNVAVITWDDALTGVNGGYVNPSEFVYSVYRYDPTQWPSYIKLGETTAEENEIELSLMDIDTSKQDYYTFAMTASNAKGESDYVRVGITMGDAYRLPFVEPFNQQGLNHAPYVTKPGKNGSGWAIDAGFYNADVQPYDEGVALVAVNTTSGADDCGFVSPIIDFANVKNPVFEIWLHHSDAMPGDAYVAVKATTDGSSDWVECGGHVDLTGNNGWQKHVFDLSKVAGKKAQVMLYASMPEPRARIFADSWNIHAATGNDLAITGITKPYSPKVGDKATINVTVTNLGSVAASDYSVLFNVDDNTVAESESKSALGIGQSAVFSFELPVTPYGDVLYNAELIYDDDNADNNISSEVEFSPEQVNLPAPGNAALESGVLSWSAPAEPVAGETLLDFEDVPAFMTNEIDGWKTVDLDGNLTITFIQYHGNYWPYANQPLAWMTWSAREAGCPDAAIWKPYAGDKCLIHFGNFGKDAEGRASDKDDDDWFISPAIAGGTEFSFMISATEMAKIEVLTSSASQATADFNQVITSYEVTTPYEWKEIKVTLPADAKYVAIRTVYDSFGILIDDIRYTPARLPQFHGYNVYRNKAAAWFGTQTSWNVPADGGRFAVSAVYDMGESAFTNEVSGVDDLLNDSNAVNVKSGKGYVAVDGCDNSKVSIYGVNGQTLVSARVASDAAWNLPAGVYMVSVEGKTFKVLVK